MESLLIRVSVEKKNQLGATECFIALIISSTCFWHLYAHHQELEIILVLLSHMVCNALVAGGPLLRAEQQAMRPGWEKLCDSRVAQFPSSRTHPRNSSPFTEPGHPFLDSNNPSTASCPNLDKSHVCPRTQLGSTVIFLITAIPRVPKYFFPSEVRSNFTHFPTLSCACYTPIHLMHFDFLP